MEHDSGSHCDRGLDSGNLEALTGYEVSEYFGKGVWRIIHATSTALARSVTLCFIA